jgi:hypothetical protein
MSQQTLKDLLKSPFKVDKDAIGDYFITDKSQRFVLKMPALKANVEMADFTATALNEKWDKDFGEPDEEGVYCSDCKHCFVDDDDVCRCKLKGDSVSVDTWIKEPCGNYERINTEPARWEEHMATLPDTTPHGVPYTYRKCPKCGFECVQKYDCCPHCGKRLLPPEDGKEKV